MKYAVISDIHGNREALAAVLKEVRRRKVERCLCLGDLIGYGADPGWCLETVRTTAVKTVRGNHDSAAFNPGGREKLNENAARAITWTVPRLSPGQFDYLRTLPLLVEEDGIALVHSSFENPGNWDYIFSPEDAGPSLRRLTGAIGFFGHSHRPGFFRLRGEAVSLIPGKKIRLEPGDRILVNPGSVGQPRDRDPRAAFAVYDRERGSVEIVRVDYPVGKAMKKIRAAGLPDWLSARLARGR